MRFESRGFCWVCGERRRHHDADMHPFVGSSAEDEALKRWLSEVNPQNRRFVDALRGYLGLEPLYSRERTRLEAEREPRMRTYALRTTAKKAMFELID